jgi:nucleoside-triphosphatase THEP1
VSIQAEQESRIVVVSGPSGCCKTALCLRVVDAAQARGLLVRGMVSPPRLVAGEKVGIDALDLGSGERRSLAEPATESTRPVGARWRFDADALAWGMAALRRALPCDVFVVDELGPMELLHSAGWAGAVDLLRGGGYRWAVVVVRPRLVERFLELFPAGQAIVVHVTRDDQDKLLELMARLWSDGGGLA